MNCSHGQPMDLACKPCARPMGEAKRVCECARDDGGFGYHRPDCPTFGELTNTVVLAGRQKRVT